MSGRRVVICQCVAQKQQSAAPARDLYRGPYWTSQRDYARAVADKWWIQSAKHGLVPPDEPLEPYDVSAADLTSEERDEWGRSVASDLVDRIGPDTTVEVLGGRDYAAPVVPWLEERGVDVEQPLQGLRIGERVAELNRLVKQATHQTLEVSE